MLLDGWEFMEGLEEVNIGDKMKSIITSSSSIH